MIRAFSIFLFVAVHLAALPVVAVRGFLRVRRHKLHALRS